jgi:hypothetical protein
MASMHMCPMLLSHGVAIHTMYEARAWSRMVKQAIRSDMESCQ